MQNIPVKYVKSFSRGQITIPKPIREDLGMGDDFWLKLYVKDGRIVGEPMAPHEEKKPSREEYIQELLAIKGDWLDPHELARNRKRSEARAARTQKRLARAFDAHGAV